MPCGSWEITVLSSAIIFTGYVFYKYYQACLEKKMDVKPVGQKSEDQTEEGAGAFDLEVRAVESVIV